MTESITRSGFTRPSRRGIWWRGPTSHTRRIHLATVEYNRVQAGAGGGGARAGGSKTAEKTH